MLSDPQLQAIVSESERLLSTSPHHPQLMDEATAIQLIAGLHAKGGEVDFDALVNCIERMRKIAVESR